MENTAKVLNEQSFKNCAEKGSLNHAGETTCNVNVCEEFPTPKLALALKSFRENSICCRQRGSTLDIFRHDNAAAIDKEGARRELVSWTQKPLVFDFLS